jgi:hypothetical protein
LQAKLETEEAIQSGNHRYNSMLNERMNREDTFIKQVECLKLEVAGKARQLRDCETELARVKEDTSAAQIRKEGLWEDERRVAKAQHAQVGVLLYHKQMLYHLNAVSSDAVPLRFSRH